MPHESRIKKSLLNAKVNLLFYLLSLFVSFFSRKIFLSTLGDDFVGLSSTLGNLLNFLNLAELGVASAIGYLLYKPLFADDRQKINEIISVFGYIYRKIGFIIGGAGCLLGCFLPWIFPDTPFSYGIIYFAYFSMLTSSLLSYFFNYKQTLLNADQRNYVVTAYYQGALLGKTLAQMGIAYYTGNYYLWIALELLFGISYTFILNARMNRIYPWLKSDIRQGKKLFRQYPEVMTYTKQLFVHKMGYFVQFQTAPLLIYAFVSLKTVTFFGNYTLIVDKITRLIGLLQSTGASVGNLIAENNEMKIRQVFWEHHILLLLIVNSFINHTRGTVDQFIEGHGLFYDTWAPITEIIINLTVSVIGGCLWGLPGILLGNISSQILIICLWKPYFLYSKGFKTSIFNYWIRYFQLFFILLLVAATCRWLLPPALFAPERSFLHWTAYGIGITLTYSLLCSTLFYVTFKEFRIFVHRFLFRKK